MSNPYVITVKNGPSGWEQFFGGLFQGAMNNWAEEQQREKMLKSFEALDSFAQEQDALRVAKDRSEHVKAVFEPQRILNQKIYDLKKAYPTATAAEQLEIEQQAEALREFGKKNDIMVADKSENITDMDKYIRPKITGINRDVPSAIKKQAADMPRMTSPAVAALLQDLGEPKIVGINRETPDIPVAPPRVIDPYNNAGISPAVAARLQVIGDGTGTDSVLKVQREMLKRGISPAMVQAAMPIYQTMLQQRQHQQSAASLAAAVQSGDRAKIIQAASAAGVPLKDLIKMPEYSFHNYDGGDSDIEVAFDKTTGQTIRKTRPKGISPTKKYEVDNKVKTEGIKQNNKIEELKVKHALEMGKEKFKALVRLKENGGKKLHPADQKIIDIVGQSLQDGSYVKLEETAEGRFAIRRYNEIHKELEEERAIASDVLPITKKATAIQKVMNDYGLTAEEAEEFLKKQRIIFK